MSDATDAPATRYSGTTRALHWISAVLIIATLPIGTIMVFEGWEQSTQNLLYLLHKNLGVIILVLLTLRLIWRVLRPAPPMPDSLPDWQARAARFTHWALYAMLLVMTISGYLRVRAGDFPIEMLDAIGMPTLIPESESLETIAKNVHFYGRYVLLALIGVHVAAAIRHVLRRDGVAQRIWPPVGAVR